MTASERELQSKFIRIIGCTAGEGGIELSLIDGVRFMSWEDITFATAVRLSRGKEEDTPILVVMRGDDEHLYYIHGGKINPRLFIFNGDALQQEASTELWVRTTGNVERDFKWVSQAICSRILKGHIDKPLIGSIKGGILFLPVFSSLKDIAEYCEKTIEGLSSTSSVGAQALEISDDELTTVSSPSEKREEWKEGLVIEGRYTVQEVLKGGMGIVYIIFDPIDVKFYALKTFQERFLWDEVAIKQFINEAEIWVKLDRHPNIVTAELVRIIEGKPYIFLEYVQGTDLEHRLNDGPLPVRTAIDLAVQFCGGMEYAFNKLGLIHRDIKPSNCLLTRDGVMKITDFGLGKIFDELPVEDGAKRSSQPKGQGGISGRDSQELSDSMSTSSTAVVGTLPFMAPELFYDMKKSGQKSDIYSFGLVLYMMLTGKNPMYSKDPLEVINNHISTVPESPRALNPEVPALLEDIVMCCLEKDPAKRFESFAEIKGFMEHIYETFFSVKYKPPETGEALSETDWINKGISLGSLKRHREAIMTFDRALEINAGSVKALIEKGAMLIQLGLNSDALKCFDKVLELESTNWEALSMKGEALWNLNMNDEALSFYDKALALKSDVPEIHCRKGRILTELHRYDEALMHFDRATDLNPKSDEAWDRRGYLLMQLGLYEDASDSFSKAIEINPRIQTSWIYRGDALYELGFYSDAINAYKRAMSFEEQANRARICIGNCYRQMGNTDRALQQYSKAIAENPSEHSAYLEKAYTLMLGYQWEEALETITDAETEGIDELHTRIVKARALLQLGYIEEASSLLKDIREPCDDWEYLFLRESCATWHGVKEKIMGSIPIDAALSQHDVFRDLNTAISVFCNLADASQHLAYFMEERDESRFWSLQATIQFLMGYSDEARTNVDNALALDALNTDALSLKEQLSPPGMRNGGRKDEKKGFLNSLLRRDKKEALSYLDWLKTAFRELKMKNSSDAIKAFQEAFKQNSSLMFCAYFLGKLFENVKEPQRSKEYLEWFINSFGYSSGYYKEKVMQQTQQKEENQELEQWYRNWIGYYHHDISPWISYIRYLEKTGLREKLRIVCHEVLKRFTDRDFLRQEPSRAWNLLGLLNMLAGRLRSARQCFENALENEESITIAHMGEARCLELQKHRSQSQELYETLVGETGAHIAVKYALTNLYCDGGDYDKALATINELIKFNERSIILQTKRAEVYIHKKQHGEFHYVYQQVHLMDQYFSPLKLLKSIAMLEAGKLDHAITDLENAVAFEPQNGILRKCLAFFWLKASQPESALEVMKDMDTGTTFDSEVSLLRGIAHYQQRSYSEALFHFTRYAHLRPNNLDNFLFYFAALYNSGERSGTEIMFQRAKRVGGKNLPAWINLGVYYIKEGKYREALQYLEGAIRLDSESYHAWFYRSFCLLKSSSLDEAQKSVERALYFCPQDLKSWALKAYIEFMKGNMKESEDSLSRTVEIDDKNEKIWNNLGIIYYFSRNHQEALKAFDRARALRDGYFNALLGKSLTYSAIGEEENAISMMQEAEKADREAYRRWCDEISDSKESLIPMAFEESIDLDFLLPSLPFRISWDPIKLMDILDLDGAFS